MSYYNGKKIREKLRARHAPTLPPAPIVPITPAKKPTLSPRRGSHHLNLHSREYAVSRLAVDFGKSDVRQVPQRKLLVNRGLPSDYVRTGLELLWGRVYSVGDRYRTPYELDQVTTLRRR